MFAMLSRWFGRLFSRGLVVLSKPYSDGESWVYLFGDERTFELRKFTTAADAQSGYEVVLAGLRSGAPEISIRLINLDVEEARLLARAPGRYPEVINRHLDGDQS
jgi:hypothetical protein